VCIAVVVVLAAVDAVDAVDAVLAERRTRASAARRAPNSQLFLQLVNYAEHSTVHHYTAFMARIAVRKMIAWWHGGMVSWTLISLQMCG
jgi:hypothetical protein